VPRRRQDGILCLLFFARLVLINILAAFESLWTNATPAPNGRIEKSLTMYSRELGWCWTGRGAMGGWQAVRNESNWRDWWMAALQQRI